MSDISPVLIALCGFSVVCLGLLVVGGFLLTRFTGLTLLPSIFGMLDGLTGGGDDEDEEYVPRRRGDSPSQRRLDSNPQAFDFDAAVERYKQQDTRGEPVDPAIPSPDPLGNDFNKSRFGVRDNDSSPGRRLRDRRYRRNAQDVDDEIFGGLLEDNDYDDER